MSDQPQAPQVKKPPSIGRPPGAKNKTSKTAKENFLAVFTGMGGTPAMKKWAKANQTEFYKLYARLIPTELAGSVAPTFLFDDPTKRPEGYQRKPEPTGP